MYFKPSTQTAFATHSEIRAAHPDVSFPASISDDTLAAHGIHPLTDGHDFGEVAQAALDASRVVPTPFAVTMRQARLALLAAGKLAAVTAAINALPSPQKEAAQIEWEYSQEVQRHNGFVAQLGPVLGLDAAALDALFVAAAGL